MVIFCQVCRGRLKRSGSEWKHEAGAPADAHKEQPLAARRCQLFDPSVIGLPGYDRTLAWLVRTERAGKEPIESWRIGVYVFDGKVRGVFRFTGDAAKRPSAMFRPPEQSVPGFLRNHPLVKERLAAAAAVTATKAR